MTKEEFTENLLSMEFDSGFDVVDEKTGFVYGIRLMDVIDIPILIYATYGGIATTITLNEGGSNIEESLKDAAEEIIEFFKDHGEGTIEKCYIRKNVSVF